MKVLNYIKNNLLSIISFICVGILIIYSIIYNVYIISDLGDVNFPRIDSVSDFIINLNLPSYITQIITYSSIIVFGILWLSIKKIRKIAIFNYLILFLNIMAFSQYFVRPLGFYPFDYNRVIMGYVESLHFIIYGVISSIILIIYIPFKTPYINTRKNNYFQIIGILISSFIVICNIVLSISNIINNSDYIINNPEYLIQTMITWNKIIIYALFMLMIIYGVIYKRIPFELTFAFSFVLLINSSNNYFVPHITNLYTGEIYSRQTAIDLLHYNFNEYKDIIILSFRPNIQFLISSVLSLSLFGLTFIGYSKNINSI